MPLLFSRRANRATGKIGAGQAADLSDRIAQALRVGAARLDAKPAVDDVREDAALAADTVPIEMQQRNDALPDDAGDDTVESLTEGTSAEQEADAAPEHRTEFEEFPRFLVVSDETGAPNVLRRATQYLRDTIETARDRFASWDLDALDTRALALSAIAAFISVLAFGVILARLDQHEPRATVDLRIGKLPDPLARSGAPPKGLETACENGACDETNVTVSPPRESSPEFRLAFADRLPAVYLSAAMTASVEPSPQPAPPEAAPNAVGTFRIRNLPPDTHLSAGIKVGSGEWEISGSDVNNLIVTLPNRAIAPVKAEIALMRPDGTQAGQVAVAIDQGVSHADAGADEAAPVKPRQRRKAKPKQVAAAPKPPQPEASVPPAEEPAAPPVPLLQALVAPPEPPAEPVPGLFNGTFLFLPGPMGLGVQPEPETTAGTDTLINLGVMPR